jgi:hypothetical protein
MTFTTAEQVYEQVVKTLPAQERLRLVEKIVHDLSAQLATSGLAQRRRWSELRGRVAYPLCGEDAQQWLSRQRREADEQREKQWRNQP